MPTIRLKGNTSVDLDFSASQMKKLKSEVLEQFADGLRFEAKKQVEKFVEESLAKHLTAWTARTLENLIADEVRSAMPNMDELVRHAIREETKKLYADYSQLENTARHKVIEQINRFIEIYVADRVSAEDFLESMVDEKIRQAKAQTHGAG